MGLTAVADEPPTSPPLATRAAVTPPAINRWLVAIDTTLLLPKSYPSFLPEFSAGCAFVTNCAFSADCAAHLHTLSIGITTVFA